MAAPSTEPNSQDPFVSLPSQPVGYVAFLAMLLTAIIHLMLGQRVLEFSQMMGTIFLLNGLGYLGGLGLYVSRYWRRELYLVAAGYALITILAFFTLQGFSPDTFYSPNGELNQLAIGAKAAEVVLVVVAVYLYTETTG